MNNEPETDAEHLEAARGFATTHWSLVLRARDQSDGALERLFRQYREPLLVWLRAQGYSPEDAEDLLHGFLEGVLRREALKGVAREKGKFRTFLIRCLKNHVRDERDRMRAAKRGGGQQLESLEETEDGTRLQQPASNAPGPDLEYDRAWAKSVLDNSFKTLEQECTRNKQQDLYTALEPVIFYDDTASPYRDIGQQLGMSEGAVKMAAKRIRDRLMRLVREAIMDTVANEQEWQEEIRYLIGLFGRQPQSQASPPASSNQ